MKCGEEWGSTIVLIIDKKAMMTDKVMVLYDENLERKHELETNYLEVCFMIVIGDFRQMHPCDKKQVHFTTSRNNMHFNLFNHLTFFKNTV